MSGNAGLILLIAALSVICFLAGVVYQQLININELTKIFKDEISGKEKEENKEENKKEIHPVGFKRLERYRFIGVARKE